MYLFLIKGFVPKNFSEPRRCLQMCCCCFEPTIQKLKIFDLYKGTLERCSQRTTAILSQFLHDYKKVKCLSKQLQIIFLLLLSNILTYRTEIPLQSISQTPARPVDRLDSQGQKTLEWKCGRASEHGNMCPEDTPSRMWTRQTCWIQPL